MIKRLGQTSTPLLGLLLTLCALPVHGEIYRWVDSEGRVHYSDRKLAPEAEDISDKVQVINVDTSQAEQRKLQEIFRPENDADREYYRQQQEAKKPSPEVINHCRRLKNLMRKLNGRIQLVDSEGKEVRYTETQRKQQAEEAQRLFNERCSHLPL